MVRLDTLDFGPQKGIILECDDAKSKTWIAQGGGFAHEQQIAHTAEERGDEELTEVLIGDLIHGLLFVSRGGISGGHRRNKAESQRFLAVLTWRL